MENTTKRLNLISPAETAAQFDVSLSTLAKWRLSGDGPPFLKVGAKIQYDRDMNEQWLLSRIRQSTSDKGKAA